MPISLLMVRVCVVWLLMYAPFGAAQPLAQPSISLKPFATDGCSMWIDGTPANPYLWRHCCVAHDKDYWLGGTEVQRKHSDEALRACVAQTGNKAMGDYLYMNVRWGGAPTWVTLYRWGYGWDYLDAGKPRGYKIPTEVEQEAIRLRLPQAEQVILEDAIKHPMYVNSGKK